MQRCLPCGDWAVGNAGFHIGKRREGDSEMSLWACSLAWRQTDGRTDKCRMVKKRQSSSDTEFRFDVPGSPDKACEAQHGAPDSPGSVFLRWVPPAVCLSRGWLLQELWPPSLGWQCAKGEGKAGLASGQGTEEGHGQGWELLNKQTFPLWQENNCGVCLRTSQDQETGQSYTSSGPDSLSGS